MVKDFARQVRKGNNLWWWITALAVAGFLMCSGTAMGLKYFFPAAPTALPAVTAYNYSTSTSLPSDAGLPTITPLPNVIYVTATPAPVSPTPLPTATVTTAASAYYWNWIFPGQRAAPTSASVPAQPTPIKVIVITVTPLPGSVPPASVPTTYVPPVSVPTAYVPPASVPTASAPFPSPPPQVSSSPNTCKNILYPARPGSQWTYYASTPKRSGDVNMRVVAVEGRQATVDAIELNTGATVRTYVQCDQDIILNFPLLSGQKLIGDIVNGTMNVDYIGGVLAPNEAAFISSNWALSWIIQYRVSGNGIVNYSGRDFYFNVLPSNVQMTCQTLGAGNASFETISVAAGTFNALKVICRGDGQVTATVNGTQVVGSMTAQATQWFAPGIGLLRSQSDYAYLNVFGISLPLGPGDVSEYIELKNYVIGQ